MKLYRHLPANLFTFVSLSLSIFSLQIFGEENDQSLGDISKEVENLKYKNIQLANNLIDKLYITEREDFSELFGAESPNPIYYQEVGSQSGYYAPEGSSKADGPLTLFRRTWLYDCAVALMLAAEKGDEFTSARALWLLKHGQYTRNPDNTKEVLFAGWNFSRNQKKYGDNWTDCRFVTGANVYATISLARYITSDSYAKLPLPFKRKIFKLFNDALVGILYHVETEGPNEGLITSGWSLSVLADFDETNYSYNRILGLLGYGPRKISGYTKPIRRIRTRNVVLEHNNNLVELLSYTLKNYSQLVTKNGKYTYNDLKSIHAKLIDSILEKLYNLDKGSFINGRTELGEKSIYTAVDNASWFSLNLREGDLNEDQLKKLSDALVYSIETFTKDFRISGKSYFGVHYFEDGFEDLYVEKSENHSKSYHIEATCGLIMGLLKFVKNNPNDPNSPLFQTTALKLWRDLQYVINEHGLFYSSLAVKNVSETMDASVSAIWYLLAVNDFEKNPRYYVIPYRKR